MSLYDKMTIGFGSGFGVGTSKLFNLKPTDGTGDFTVTRADTDASELVTNGAFATDASWTKGSGWTISGGLATSTGAIGGITQSISVTSGVEYYVEITTSGGSYSLGGLKVRLGGSTDLATITEDGTYVFKIECGSASTILGFYVDVNNAFNGSIDDVSVKSADFGYAATRINAEGLIEGVRPNVPRSSYPAGGSVNGCPYLLLEPSSTNLYLNSDTLVTQGVATSADDYTVTFYGTGTITFTGTYTGSLVGTGANDRVSLTFTATAGTLTSTVSGTVENAQCENLGYETSYIPTDGSTKTRQADQVNNAGDSGDFNDDEGVLVCNIAALNNDLTNRFITISDGTSSNVVTIYYSSLSQTVQGAVVVGGGTQASFSHVVSDVTEFILVAIRYKNNDFSLWVDGGEVDSDVSGNTFAPGTLTELSFDSGGVLDFYGKCYNLMVFNQYLTDDEMQYITLSNNFDFENGDAYIFS